LTEEQKHSYVAHTSPLSIEMGLHYSSNDAFGCPKEHHFAHRQKTRAQNCEALFGQFVFISIVEISPRQPQDITLATLKRGGRERDRGRQRETDKDRQREVSGESTEIERGEGGRKGLTSLVEEAKLIRSGFICKGMIPADIL
jgi:hypothetical protein